MIPDPPPLPPYLPYDDGPFRMALGLQSLPERDWIEIDANYRAHLAERRRLIETRRADVIASLPEAGGAPRELLLMLAAHLPHRFPDWFQGGDGALENRLSGTCHALDDGDELATAGLLVQEDFCLLRQEDDGLRLVAAVLCFPSRWRLSDKIGRLLGPIHQPVPFYADTLARPVDRFLGVLKPGRLTVRLNWSIMDDPALFQPTGHGRDAPSSAITPENCATGLFLRVERQTFRRLPQSGIVAFGIKIHVTPLGAVLRSPGEAARLRAAVLALPPDMARYKSMLPFRTALLDYLEALGQAASAAR